MERKIGEIFEYNGEWYQCVGGTCRNCSFYYDTVCKNITTIGSTNFGNCHCSLRTDHKSVIFKKLEKVGEPFYRRWTLEGNNKLMQRYKIYITPLITIDKQKMFYNLTDDLLEIEIKEEDMEEKGQCCDNRFEIINKAKEVLLKETNIARDEQEMAVIDNILFRCWQMGWLDKYDDTKHSNSENIGKSLKPFDLEAAKAGKPVCTRDGRKARIICFDRNDLYPIVALIECEDGKEIIGAYSKEGQTEIYEIKGTNLMMLPEKKEGWVNVDKRSNGNVIISKPYPTRDEAIHNSTELTIDTVKIKWDEIL